MTSKNSQRSGASSYTTLVFFLMTLFILRGLILLCVYPPLEGIDEHKHLGYLAFVSETHSIPVYGQSTIPSSLLPALQNNPHSRYGASELTSLGVRDYTQFWSSPPPSHELPSLDNGIPVKAAFHPPGYYFLASPLFHWSSIRQGFRETVYLLRIINLILAALALGFFLMALRPFCGTTTVGYLAATVVGLLPLLPVYVGRVSNDALALLVIGLVFFTLSQTCRQKYFIVSSLLLGVLLGAGIWIRVNVVPFIPVVLIFFAWLVLSRQISRRSFALGTIGFILLTGVISYGVFAWNIGHYRTLFPSQEIFRMDSHSGIAWNGTLIGRILGELFIQRLLIANLWTSGWSFLHLPAAVYLIYGLFLAFLIFCLAEFILRSRTRLPAAGWNLPLLCLLAFIFVCLGALMHALQSIRANAGIISTPSYYALPGYLPFLGVALYSMNRKKPLLQFTVSAALMILFLAAEWGGTFLVGVPYWSQSSSLMEALARLQSIHPAFPSPKWLPLLIALYAGIGCAIGWLIFKKRASHGGTTTCPQPDA